MSKHRCLLCKGSGKRFDHVTGFYSEDPCPLCKGECYTDTADFQGKPGENDSFKAPLWEPIEEALCWRARSDSEAIDALALHGYRRSMDAVHTRRQLIKRRGGDVYIETKLNVLEDSNLD